ncbi:uncharacterized protein SAPINGB_P005991 [Magnusiomyces paraingens]|uniref:ER membrane protein complex subunit 3 n=1 Tax=Magnusiomyces paraingens TaxID=2606893 RepID=A0A5E8C7W3_9ASCO|nr:uncharacterized protein SAPINGB_P005991 [Saprochaete ingens]VVT58008.1 unnamed protein product [Saprochaete ingens]
MSVPDLVLDPQLTLWVLFPILFVMILFGVCRHYASLLITSKPKRQELKAVREQQFLVYAQSLRTNGVNLSDESLAQRIAYQSEQLKKGAYLKNPDAQPNAPPSLSDPSSMEGMMGMIKSQALNFVPQTIMMTWVNALFSGFVLMKLPFPLTIRFKSMLQSGVATPDLDVRWVSAVSWYVLNLIGLKSVFALLLGNDNTAGGLQNQATPAMPQLGTPGLDPSKLFIAEAENLQLTVPESLLNGIESRLLRKYSVPLN